MSTLLMEIEVKHKIGADRDVRTDQRTRLAQWLSGSHLDYSSRGDFAQDSQTARGELFPEPARTPTASNACSARRDPRSLYPRCKYEPSSMNWSKPSA